MELVTGAPAPTVSHDEAVRLLHEMAAVVRVLFAVPAAAAEAQAPSPAPLVAPAPVPTPAAIPLPDLAARPDLEVPKLAPREPDSTDRRSMALLHEIAFLDD